MAAKTEEDGKPKKEEVEDEHIFEIVDFTLASEWEKFTAKIVEVLHKWGLDNGQYKLQTAEEDGGWRIRMESVNFGDFHFEIQHHFSNCKNSSSVGQTSHVFPEGFSPVLKDMFDPSNDFPPRTHCLNRWFGLKEFLVLLPQDKSAVIHNESRLKLVLSSLSGSFNSANCVVPVFALIQQPQRRLYSGSCQGGGFYTSFEMSHLAYTPEQYHHLEGLVKLFKDRLQPESVKGPVNVAIRFTYILSDWWEQSWPQLPPDVSHFGGEVGFTTWDVLPFGAVNDPISELHLSTTWPSISEEVVIENGVYSDLDPMQAPQWSLRMIMPEDVQCLLGTCLESYLKICDSRYSWYGQQSFETENLEGESQIEFSQALQRLTDPAGISTVTKTASKIASSKPVNLPIPSKELDLILKHLFPDAELGPREDSDEDENPKTQSESSSHDIADKHNIKSAPEGSLTFLIAVCLAIVNHSFGGLKAVAHLWQEIVLEMRYRWENSCIIPGLDRESPQLQYNIIHQKLQMLNCCIERKKLGRKRGLSECSVDRLSSKQTFSSAISVSADDSNSDEEFYETVEDEEELKKFDIQEPEVEELELVCSSEDIVCKDKLGNSFVREGVAEESTKWKLLVSGEPLFIPITQEQAPLTEDMLEQQTAILSQLGSSAEGSRIRAQMQCASLLSDMEAFKAANPGCLLEDFIRWYSPADWIPGPQSEEEKEEIAKLKKRLGAETTKKEEPEPAAAESMETEEDWDTENLGTDELLEEVSGADSAKSLILEAISDHVFTTSWCEEGHLSMRMQVPGNAWVETWESAKAVPVRRQRRLFNETKEAEKVLHFLAALTPADVATELFPVIIHSSILRIQSEGGENVPSVSEDINQLLKSPLLGFRPAEDHSELYKEMVKDVKLAELKLARVKSLRHKFHDAIMKECDSGNQEDAEAFIRALAEKPEVALIAGSRGPLASVIKEMFQKQQIEENDVNELSLPVSSFPTPVGREYILRSVTSGPGDSRRECPQRLYAVITRGEFRVCGAVTQDTTFL